jgi:cytochrome b pre-mRNA-processing protein 3
MTFWSKVLRKTAPARPERAVYEAIVASARRPFLYADLGVPDTVAGRFDMIVLHSFLVLERVKDAEPQFAQALTDEIFRDMDRSLREMGVGDISVGKKVRTMAEVFYGRVAAYRTDFADAERLSAALIRNVWSRASDDGKPAELAMRARHLRDSLSAQSPAVIASGRVRLP